MWVATWLLLLHILYIYCPVILWRTAACNRPHGVSDSQQWLNNKATCELTDCRQPGELLVIFVRCKSLYFSVISRFLCFSNLSVVQKMSSSEVVNFNARQLKQEIYSKCVKYLFSFLLCSCYSCHCCFFSLGSLSACDSFLNAFEAKGLKPEALCPCASSTETMTVALRRYRD